MFNDTELGEIDLAVKKDPLEEKKRIKDIELRIKKMKKYLGFEGINAPV
ncbi:MAG: hypothetical protein WCJ58_05625 [bacterium]